MTNVETTVTVRDATSADVGQIVLFNQRMAEETENKQLDAARLRSGVERGLARPDLCRYFMAEQDGRVVGQAMVTYEWSDWRDGLFWWLQSVYVVVEYRRRGVFRSLFRHAEALARRTPDVCGLRLYVAEHNDRARASYDRLGMASTGYIVCEADWTKER